MIQYAPPVHRVSMVHQPFKGRMGPARLKGHAVLRRLVLGALVAASAWYAAAAMSTILNTDGMAALKDAIVCIFSILFGWISITFWSVLAGFVVLMKDRVHCVSFKKPWARIPSACDVAVVMPIYNEAPRRILAGLQTMYESLQKTGTLRHFSFFILSDSDRPRQCQEEEAAFEELCRRVNGWERIFYRRRKIRIHKKSGNIADFCRRWGVQYTYMIVLDADSLMSGQAMVDMVRIMESHADIGILQTAPKGINQKSLISRINQFTSHLYGPLLLAGAHFWQLDEAGFWGHNAIVRLAPFMKYCVLPKLRGPAPFGGEILSHDFVEAALMRRAGWGVWLAYNLADSYEELPPDFLGELERDRRWCRGNIQHLRLMFMKGFTFGHRLLFLNGNMFYFSALLWLMMLVLMTAYAIGDFFHKKQYFNSAHSLFPDWPIQHPVLSLELLWLTVAFLFLPKMLSIAWAAMSGEIFLYGGAWRLIVSVVLETLFSAFLAPIRMLFHSWFVIAGLCGGKLEWGSQHRRTKKTSLWKAFKAHGLGTVIALMWAVVAFEVNRVLFLWISVIVVPLVLAIPLSMAMSSAWAGSLFKKLGLFMTPVEIRPSVEIARLNALNSHPWSATSAHTP